MPGFLNTDAPVLWFLNRSTGAVLLVVLTASIVLGCATTGRRAGGLVPVFVLQRLHRNLSVLALALTMVHVGTAVLDEYVDIRWWQAFSPVGATYQPLWLGLGVVASDLMLVLALTTALRRRLGTRTWKLVHLCGYLTWPTALAHGAGIGTDAGTRSGLWLALGCGAAVVLAAGSRLARLRTDRTARPPALVHAGSQR